jgi:hypothetical protein
VTITRIAMNEEEARKRGSNPRPLGSGYGTSAERYWLYDTHAGLCLSTSEENGYDDSDFYALVWNEEKGAPEKVMYASTRFWSYPCVVSIDATPEVRAKFEAWWDEQQREIRRARQAREAAEPRKGKTIRVVRGRKVPIGTTGVCIWRGQGKAFTWYQARNGAPERVGLKTENGEVFWTALRNVEVVQEQERVAA